MREPPQNDPQNAQSEKADPAPEDLVSEDRPGGGEEKGQLSPELQDLAGKALGYHESALSENTREAYQRGWEDFLSFFRPERTLKRADRE